MQAIWDQFTVVHGAPLRHASLQQMPLQVRRDNRVPLLKGVSTNSCRARKKILTTVCRRIREGQSEQAAVQQVEAL